jgi:hypothetical protein
LPNGEYFPNANLNYFDGSLGMSFNTTFGSENRNTMFLGAAYHHFNRPKNSFYRNAQIELNPKYVFSVVWKLNMDEYTFFTLQADQSLQGPFKETIGGALYSWKWVVHPDHRQYVLHTGAFLRLEGCIDPCN